MAGQHEGHLGAVYGATDPADVAAAYDAWAETYEAEMRAAGYRHPSIGVALLARHMAADAGPVLDAGAGTGLVGEWLAILGYHPVQALDLSAGMLAVAARKGVYAGLTQAALGTPLPFPDGHFAGVISTGVFTTGHVGAAGLPELFRITRKGGVIVLTVKSTLWQAEIDPWLTASRIGRVETTAPYVSMPGDPATIPSLAVVLRA
ncbi:MAG: class I SAM-dependent DNA methyltransferase [Gemmobacter sp.]